MIQSIWRGLGFIVTVLSLIYFGRYLYQNINQLDQFRLGFSGFLLLLSLVALYALGVLIACIAWNILLRQRDYKLTIRQAFSIDGKALFAKYLPGNIAHHAGRVLLAKRAGIPVSITLQTTMLEIVYLLGLGAFLSCIAAYHYAILLPKTYLSLDPLDLFFVLLAILMVSMFGFSCLWGQITKILRRYEIDLENFSLPNFMATLKVLSLQLISFLIGGAIMAGLSRYVFLQADASLFFFVTLYAISWISGFIVPGAPAGLGVREAIILATVGPLYGSGVAIGLAALTRIISSVGDLLVFVLAFLPVNSNKELG